MDGKPCISKQWDQTQAQKYSDQFFANCPIEVLHKLLFLIDLTDFRKFKNLFWEKYFLSSPILFLPPRTYKMSQGDILGILMQS